MTSREAFGVDRAGGCRFALADALLEVKIFPGTHFYMREQEADFLHYIQKTIEGETAV